MYIFKAYKQSFIQVLLNRKYNTAFYDNSQLRECHKTDVLLRDTNESSDKLTYRLNNE